MAMTFAFIVFLSVMQVFVEADQVVMTNNGPLQGITLIPGKIKIKGFLGIPYAEPPIGKLRFQKPVPKTPWKGVYNASSLPPACSQNGTSTFYYEPNLEGMTEDCLYLNIWVPYSKKSTSLKPVLVYLHGGAFNGGASKLKVFDGSNLALRGDIIVATINYRVGILGFFTSLTEDAVGNFGLYDQTLALKWIQANIKLFGGNPGHIVLMGNSAGAMTITGHAVSPLSRNIFKRAIFQSGGGIMPIIQDENKRLTKTSQKLANMVGCADSKITLENNPRIVVECMKQLSDKQLVNAEGVLMKTNPITFFPRIGDDFLPKTVMDLIREGEFQNMEMIFGINKEEGNIFLTTAAPQLFGVLGVNSSKWIGKMFANLGIYFIFKKLGQPKQREISDFYLSSVENKSAIAYTKAIAESMGDYLITCNAVFTAEFCSLENPVYFYVFTRRPSSTVTAEWLGSTHFDEVQYTFGNPIFENFTAEEMKMSNRIMDRWITFIKTGNPNIPNELTWPRFSLNKTEFLRIDDEDSIGTRPDNQRCEFWRDRFQARIDGPVIDKHKYINMSSSAGNVRGFPLKLISSLTLGWIKK